MGDRPGIGCRSDVRLGRAATSRLAGAARDITICRLHLDTGVTRAELQRFGRRREVRRRAAATTLNSSASEPTPFTAHLVWVDSDVGSTTYTVLDGHSERRGAVFAPRFTASDSRLEGRLTISDDEDIYPGQDGTFFVGTMTWRLESEDGAWQGSSRYFSFSNPEYFPSQDMLFLAGEGAYEGLYAAIALPAWGAISPNIFDLQRVIFPAAPPAAPTAS